MIACRNPDLAHHRAKKREALITATEKALEKIRAQVNRRTLRGKDKVGMHYARAELVTLVLEGAAPVFVDHRRVELIDGDLPSVPYHHVLGLRTRPVARWKLRAYLNFLLDSSRPVAGSMA